jgi:hypothetical protein
MGSGRMDAFGPFFRRCVELPSLVGRGIVPLLHTVSLVWLIRPPGSALIEDHEAEVR